MLELMDLTDKKEAKTEVIPSGEDGQRRKRNWKNSALHGFLALLAVMLAFTVISRAAASFTVVRVTVQSPSARKIDHTITAEGTVEKNRELAVLTQPNLLVQTIYVSVGEKVAQGDLLALLLPESIDEQIGSLKNEIEVLKLQNEAAGSSAAKEQQAKSMEQARAKEDYGRTAQEQSELVAAAQARLQRAWDDLAAFDQQPSEPQQEQPNEPQQEMTPSDALGTEGDALGDSGESDVGSGGAGGQTAGGSSAEERAAQRQTLEEAIREAQSAYDEALRSQEKARVDAGRRVEDAGLSSPKDTTMQINNLSIEEKEKSLKKLEELKADGGKITAPVDGVITEMNIVTGQRTADTAAVTMADITSGMRYVAQIDEEAAKYLAAGDSVSLKAGGKEISDLTVLGMEPDSEKKQVAVTVLLQQDLLSIGDTATMQAVKQSESYPLTIPVSALHSENGKNYVYVLAEEESVLGKQLTARRVDVEVKDQNGQFAAIISELLSDSDSVITGSDGYIQAGDQVRLQES